MCSECSVVDLSMNNVDITGGGFTGGVVGYGSGRVTIINVHVQGVIQTDGSSIGGLVGEGDDNCDISYSSVDLVITVTAGSRQGGLLGRSETATIVQSFSKGSIVGGTNSAGLVCLNDNHLYIRDSYSWMSVQGTFGYGIISSIAIAGYSQILNSYQKALLDNIGGSQLIGGSGNPHVTNIYWGMDTSTLSSSTYGTGLDATQIKQKSSFVGFDFDDVWYIDEGIDSPRLRWELP